MNAPAKSAMTVLISMSSEGKDASTITPTETSSILPNLRVFAEGMEVEDCANPNSALRKSMKVPKQRQSPIKKCR